MTPYEEFDYRYGNQEKDSDFGTLLAWLIEYDVEFSLDAVGPYITVYNGFTYKDGDKKELFTFKYTTPLSKQQEEKMNEIIKGMDFLNRIKS